MALVDLKSDLSWYGKKPSVNYMQNDNASGFTTDQRELGPSQFVGISGIPGGMQYQHTGIRNRRCTGKYVLYTHRTSRIR